MQDILNRNDIEALLFAFYDKAIKDPVIGHFFTEVIPINLETHIPVIADFWVSVVLNAQVYKKNVMEIHQHISNKSTIKKEHLDQWIRLFHATINEKYSGPNAELMKQRAASIATLMQIKLN
ncbi:MAG: group III truncated hemoglobin [Flavisolibacter sp.]|jgi:hemoglobin|nr:group III truncated hemoglobin [Flavisolibacter sp.]